MTAPYLTANFNLQQLYPGQAQKDVVVNTDLVTIDTLLQPIVVMQTNVPPSPSADQTIYLVGISPTGAWAGHANALALWNSNGSFWSFFTPQYGWTVFNQQLNSLWTFGGSAWGPAPVSASSVNLTSYSVVSIGNTPPASPANGATYIVGTVPTGAWIGEASQFATWNAGTSSWIFTAPIIGWTAYNQATNTLYAWNGSSWIAVQNTALQAMMYALIFGG